MKLLQKADSHMSPLKTQRNLGEARRLMFEAERKLTKNFLWGIQDPVAGGNREVPRTAETL